MQSPLKTRIVKTTDLRNSLEKVETSSLAARFGNGVLALVPMDASFERVKEFTSSCQNFVSSTNMQQYSETWGV